MHFPRPIRRAATAACGLIGGLCFSASAAELATVEGGAVELRDGTTTLWRLRPETSAVRRGTPVLTQQTVDGHRLTEVRIPVRGTAREEVWIGELGDRGGRLLWNGFSGPRDSDEEVAIHVDLTSDGITEYQTAAPISRCDGQPVRLFPRAWDFGAGRFRPVLSPLPPPAAQSIVARRDDPAAPSGRPAGGFQWLAASTTASEGRDARGLTAPAALNDGNPTTVWAEGLGGDGRGEFLTARSSGGALPISGLRIVPGDASSAAAFRARNRLRRFQVALGPGADLRFDVAFPTDPLSSGEGGNHSYWVPLPHPVLSSCVTVVLADVYRGTEAAPPKNFGTTAISDIEIFTDLDRPGGRERLVAAMAADTNCGARVPLLVSLGEPALSPTTQALATATGVGRTCLVDALVRLAPVPKTELVVGALVSALRGASPTEESALAAALATAEPPPVAALEKILASSREPVDERARAARVLGALDASGAPAALLAAAGRGPDEVRAAVVQALGVSRPLTPEAFWTTLGLDRRDVPAPIASDLLQALPLFLRGHPDARAGALPALRSALAPERPFEIRGRAVMAIGGLRTSDGAAALAEVRSRSDEPALRLLATRELASDPGAPATAALLLALSDQDPGVRETAALALGERRESAASDAIVAGAKQEPWPAVRRAEMEALGHLCTPQGNDLLIRAVARDGADVRRVSLVGLTHCHDPRSTQVLLRTLARHDETATARALAATLLGELGDPATTPALAAAMNRLVSESEADMALEAPVLSALRALARLGGADAVKAVTTLATDRHHPFQAAAIDALGVLCDARTGAAALQHLTAGSDGRLAQAAQGAQRRCAATAR